MWVVYTYCQIEVNNNCGVYISLVYNYGAYIQSMDYFINYGAYIKKNFVGRYAPQLDENIHIVCTLELSARVDVLCILRKPELKKCCSKCFLKHSDTIFAIKSYGAFQMPHNYIPPHSVDFIYINFP